MFFCVSKSLTCSMNVFWSLELLSQNSTSSQLSIQLVNCCGADMTDILEKMNSELEKCNRALLGLIETRRQIFPRFYFLSNEDVLHIVCTGLWMCSKFLIG